MGKLTLSIVTFFSVLIILFFVGVILMTYNPEPKWRWNQVCNDADKRAKFIIDCAKAANPMSDEEGEDLVKQCDSSSRELFCHYTKEYY